MASKPVKIRTRLIGTTQYAQHNVQLADPDNHWAREIAKLTAKRKKTEEDRREIRHLEFIGGLYISEGRVAVPKLNVRRCFQETAKATRRGKDIVRALNLANPAELFTPLVFDGSELSSEELWAAETKDPETGQSGKKYADTTIVAVRGRTPRCRPAFFPWGLTVDWVLLSNLLDVEEFKVIVQDAGLIEGLGDNRVNGWGRFETEVSEL